MLIMNLQIEIFRGGGGREYQNIQYMCAALLRLILWSRRPESTGNVKAI